MARSIQSLHWISNLEQPVKARRSGHFVLRSFGDMRGEGDLSHPIQGSPQDSRTESSDLAGRSTQERCLRNERRIINLPEVRHSGSLKYLSLFSEYFYSYKDTSRNNQIFRQKYIYRRLSAALVIS